MSKKTSQNSIEQKQKWLYYALVGVALLLMMGFAYLITRGDAPRKESSIQSNAFEVTTDNVKAEDVRVSNLENLNDVMTERMEVLEGKLFSLHEDNALLSREKQQLEDKLDNIEAARAQEQHNLLLQMQANSQESQSSITGHRMREWQSGHRKEGRHISYEIPAGTVVKAVLVSGADCSVGVHKPTGPNMVLLQPLSHGRLPKKLQVPLKGSVIIGNAIGDISSERVFIRTERMTLIQKNGDFIETEISAYISGEDGREGMRGIVVDKSGLIISRAGFAAFLQGMGQGIQATLGNQTLEKLARVSSEQSILNLDLARTSGFQGMSTALGKMADYYIKRSEQLQPTIQIAAGRVVDVIFTKTVKIGEKNLRKRLEVERKQSSGRS